MPQLQLARQAHGFAHPLILFQSAIIPMFLDILDISNWWRYN